MTMSSHAGRRIFSQLNALLILHALLLSGGTLTALKTPVHAAPRHEAQDDKAYTLTRVYKAKDVSKYKYVVSSSVNVPQLGGQVDIVINMALRETVKDVKNNGDTILLTEFDSASFKLPNADEADITAFMPTVTATVDKQGKIIDTVIEGGNDQFTKGPGSNMFKSLQQQNFFPEKPVKVGDTWKIDTNSKDKSVKSNGTATLVAVETIDGLSTAKVKIVTDSEVTINDPETNKPTTVKTHGESIVNYEISTGRMVKMNMKSTSDSGQVGKTEINMTLQTGKNTDTKKSEAKK